MGILSKGSYLDVSLNPSTEILRSALCAPPYVRFASLVKDLSVWDEPTMNEFKTCTLRLTPSSPSLK